MNKHKKILLLLLCVIFCNDSFAQDLKAGEINVSHITGNEYKATLIFYYETSNFTNRPYLLIDWGDVTLDTIQWDLFIGGCGDSNSFTKNFVKVHTYSGDGNYLISCVDSFRINNIVNISNSNLERLSLQYNLIINSFYPPNNSPSSLNCLTDTWTGTAWMYNSGAYDDAGDSLSYSLVAPQGLTNYTFPSYTINNLTGDFTLSPSIVGEYAICIKIDEWKLFPSSTARYYFGSSYRNVLVDVNSLASISENFDSYSFFLYPQPAQSQITIEFDLTETKNVFIEIKNVLGQNVKIIDNRSFTNGKNKIDVNVSDLSNGLYFIQLRNNKKNLSKMFVKQN